MKTKKFPLSSAFSEVHSGDIHSSSALDEGKIPLISCKTEKTKEHGVEGFFDIPEDKTYEKCVIITCDGDQPTTASYHLHKLAAKDNVLVCIPKDNVKLSTLFYAISYLNSQRWRFSYGRKCYENKIDKLKIDFPVDKNGNIDEDLIEKNIKCDLKPLLPQKNKTKELNKTSIKFKEYCITELFDPLRGDFHSLQELEKGSMPTVSRTSLDNGVTGKFEPPEGATIYPAGYLTVSTVSGEAFLQTEKFIATDNVLVLEPKQQFRLSTLFFIQLMLNRQLWRYSYGRQAYETKFSETTVLLPTKGNRKLDEELMERFVKNTSYWNFVKSIIKK